MHLPAQLVRFFIIGVKTQKEKREPILSLLSSLVGSGLPVNIDNIITAHALGYLYCT